MSEAEPAAPRAPMIVRTHVTPWGFVLALPMALAFAYLGARTLDAGIVPERLGSFIDPPIWLFGALLIGFALFLFLIGVAELAAYLKPSVGVVVDESGVTTFGVLGARRVGWSDIVSADLNQVQLALKARRTGGSRLRDVRLYFSRLAVEPTALVTRIQSHRPDLAAYWSGPGLGRG
jgi:hypothetical protein